MRPSAMSSDWTALLNLNAAEEFFMVANVFEQNSPRLSCLYWKRITDGRREKSPQPTFGEYILWRRRTFNDGRHRNGHESY